MNAPSIWPLVQLPAAQPSAHTKPVTFSPEPSAVVRAAAVHCTPEAAVVVVAEVVVVVASHTFLPAAASSLSFASVWGPSSPSGVRPAAFWNSRMAASVAGPMIPSMAPL